MPDFVYSDDEKRVYLAFGEVERGAVVTADEAPDVRFAPVKKPKTAPAVADTTPEA